MSSLADLTVNSKPLINMLTMLAEENVESAHVIVKCIEKHLSQVSYFISTSFTIKFHYSPPPPLPDFNLTNKLSCVPSNLSLSALPTKAFWTRNTKGKEKVKHSTVNKSVWPFYLVVRGCCCCCGGCVDRFPSSLPSHCCLVWPGGGQCPPTEHRKTFLGWKMK